MNKESLRKKILAQRIAFFTSSEFDLACSQICKNIQYYLSTINLTPNLQQISKLGIKNKYLVGGYYPIKGEVDLTEVYISLEKLAFPRLIFVKNTFEIEYAKVNSISELTDSKLNFKAPSSNAPLCFPDIIIVPAICYDNERNRLGYGRGHFDKFIAKAKKSNYIPLKIGVCFDFQLQESIPIESHDQTMNVIITESKII